MYNPLIFKLVIDSVIIEPNISEKSLVFLLCFFSNQNSKPDMVIQSIIPALRRMRQKNLCVAWTTICYTFSKRKRKKKLTKPG